MSADWPDSLEGLRFRWSAEMGVDLTTGPAVPLRAYLESHRIGDMTRNADLVYPGFQRAVPAVGKPRDDDSSDLPYELWSIQPATDLVLGEAQRYYGNEYFHVLAIESIDDRTHRAYVCDGRYNIFRDSDTPGKYVSAFSTSEGVTEDLTGPDLAGIKLWRIEYADQTAAGASSITQSISPQKGSSPAPRSDMFAGWQITGANNDGLWGPNDFPDSTPGGWGRGEEYQRLYLRCLDKMPHDTSQRQTIYSSELDAPPVPEPAVPGWPGYLP
ncbi:hypothetical protein ABQF34_08800 [Mycolicibacterium boenickei]